MRDSIVVHHRVYPGGGGGDCAGDCGGDCGGDYGGDYGSGCCWWLF